MIAAAYTTCSAATLTHSAGSTAAIVVSITITIVVALSHSAGSTSAAGTVIGST